MARSFKTLTSNDQILPALLAEFPLISGCIPMWADELKSRAY